MSRRIVIPGENFGADEPPNNTVEIRYDNQQWTKGDAWRHLWANTPAIKYGGHVWTPFWPELRNSTPDKPRRGNPYRKNHTDTHWVWTVVQWVVGRPKKVSPEATWTGPSTPVQTRYQLIIDEEWL